MIIVAFLNFKKEEGAMNFSKVIVSEAKEKKAKKKFGFFSKKEKAHYLALWQASDLSQSAFCQQQGIKLSTFNNWLRKEKKRKSQNQPIELVEQETSPERSNKIASEGYVKLWLPNGCCLDFSLQDNIENIARLARALS